MSVTLLVWWFYWARICCSVWQCSIGPSMHHAKFDLGPLIYSAYGVPGGHILGVDSCCFRPALLHCVFVLLVQNKGYIGGVQRVTRSQFVIEMQCHSITCTALSLEQQAPSQRESSVSSMSTLWPVIHSDWWMNWYWPGNLVLTCSNSSALRVLEWVVPETHSSVVSN